MSADNSVYVNVRVFVLCVLLYDGHDFWPIWFKFSHTFRSGVHRGIYSLIYHSYNMHEFWFTLQEAYQLAQGSFPDPNMVLQPTLQLVKPSTKHVITVETLNLIAYSCYIICIPTCAFHHHLHTHHTCMYISLRLLIEPGHDSRSKKWRNTRIQ